MLFSSSALTSINLISRRFIKRKVNLKAWPNDWVPFVWNRPQKSPGYYDEADLTNMAEPNPKMIRPDLRMSKELLALDADEPLKKIFSLSHAKRSKHNKAYVEKHVNNLGLIHKVDHSMSLEAKIITLTYTLRQLYESVKYEGEDGRYNGHLRSMANSVKYRRTRYLTELKELHSDRYNRMIESLDLAPKDNPINVKHYRPYRKVQMRLIATDYAKDLKEKKVEDFMKSLEKEKLEFEKYKQESLNWIEEKERYLSSLEHQSAS